MGRSSPQVTTANGKSLPNQTAAISNSNSVKPCKAGNTGERLGRTPKQQPRQRQNAAGRLLRLPPELLYIILSYVDKDSWAGLHRACKQTHKWIVSQAVAGWSSKVETKLYMYSDFQWWKPDCYHHGTWEWMQHPHTPTYLMLQQQQLQHPNTPPNYLQQQQVDWLAFIHSGQTDSNEVKSIMSAPGMELHLNITAPKPPLNIFQPAPVPTPPVYVQSWLAFFLNAHQALPSVAACFSQITIIRLQNVRLTHPLPDCIGTMCTSLRKYVLSSVVWLEPLQPGKPWPQLQHLAISTTSTAQLPQLINPTTLPGLQGLYITSWPDWPVAPAVACCAALSRQLTALVLGPQESLGAIFGGAKSKPFPNLVYVEVQHTLQDKSLQALLTAAPALQHLKVKGLQLSRSHAKRQCKLQHLEVSNMPEL